MRWWLVLVFTAALTSPAAAWDYCYTSEVDPQLTIIVRDGELVRSDGQETTTMTTMGAGTGIPFTEATEPDGTTHSFRFIGGDLVFDMVIYELGCPTDMTWVDSECERILISQSTPYARATRFYYLEPGHPLTDCTTPTPFENTRFNELRCSSGRTMKVDTDDYRVITVDGIEMSLYDGSFPCGPLSKP